MYDYDIVPQNKIENLTSEIERIMTYTHKYAKIERLNEVTWLPFIQKEKSNVKNIYNNDMLIDEDKKNPPVTWIYENNKMFITLQAPKDDVQVTEERIDSPVLRGKWWGKVSDLEVLDVADIVQISFTTDEKENWPYLIIGDNPDGTSCYFLGLISLELHDPKFAEMWLARSSCLECHSAITSYVMTLFEQERYEECCHWASRCIIKFGDQLCGYILAKNLIDGRGVFKNPQIGEFMLCRLVLQGMPDAFCELGKLYLNGNDGVEPMVEKAKYLLTLAAYQFNDDEAKRLLNDADFSPSRREEENEKNESENKNNEDKTDNNENSVSIIDWIITSGLVAATALTGYVLFRRFYKRK